MDYLFTVWTIAFVIGLVVLIPAALIKAKNSNVRSLIIISIGIMFLSGIGSASAFDFNNSKEYQEVMNKTLDAANFTKNLSIDYFMDDVQKAMT